MSRLFLAVILFTSAACGLPPEADEGTPAVEASSSPITVKAAPVNAQLARAQIKGTSRIVAARLAMPGGQPTAQVARARPEDPTAEQPAQPNGFAAEVHGASTAPEGTTVHLAVAFLSCGYGVSAVGATTVTSGSVDARFEGAVSESSTDLIFAWIDGNGDGVCDAQAGDTILQSDTQDAAGDLSFDFASFKPGDGWLCQFFSPYGG